MQGRGAVRLGRVHVSLGRDQLRDARGVAMHGRVGDVARGHGVAVNHCKRKRCENRNHCGWNDPRAGPGCHSNKDCAETVTLQH